METFHSEHAFEIKKTKEQFGLTFSKGAWEMMMSAIVHWLGKQVFDHWATKHLKIKIVIDGEYNPEEKPKKGGDNGKEN